MGGGRTRDALRLLGRGAGDRAIDGQNDVSGSLLVVLALVALAFAGPEGRWARVAWALSAVCLGWAIAFTQSAFIAPFFAQRIPAHSWRSRSLP